MTDATLPRVGTGHEPDAPSLRGLVIGAGVVVAAVALAIGVAFVLVDTGPRATRATAATSRALQPTPAVDIEAYRREKEALLEGYAWVDRAHGVVRIPIEEAMRLLAARDGTPQR